MPDTARKVVITRGVDEKNAFTQPRQDARLKTMQPNAAMGGTVT